MKKPAKHNAINDCFQLKNGAPGEIIRAKALTPSGPASLRSAVLRRLTAACRTAYDVVGSSNLFKPTKYKRGLKNRPRLYLARPERFELPTAWFVVIPLSTHFLL